MDTNEILKVTEEFMKEHNFTKADMNNLRRYEMTRQSGEMNMMEYISVMKRYKANGGSKLADWIMTKYGEYLNYLETINK